MVSSVNLQQDTNPTDALQRAMSAYEGLSIDDKLGFLWVAYENMGGSITPAAPGAADEQFTENLLNEVKQMESEAQLEFMRALLNKQSNEQTKQYEAYTDNNKLLFWYELAELMRAGEVIPVPENYELSADASQVLNETIGLEFNEQITLLRHAVV